MLSLSLSLSPNENGMFFRSFNLGTELVAAYSPAPVLHFPLQMVNRFQIGPFPHLLAENRSSSGTFPVVARIVPSSLAVAF